MKHPKYTPRASTSSTVNSGTRAAAPAGRRHEVPALTIEQRRRDWISALECDECSVAFRTKPARRFLETKMPDKPEAKLRAIAKRRIGVWLREHREEPSFKCGTRLVVHHCGTKSDVRGI